MRTINDGHNCAGCGAKVRNLGLPSAPYRVADHLADCPED